MQPRADVQSPHPPETKQKNSNIQSVYRNQRRRERERERERETERVREKEREGERGSERGRVLVSKR